MLLLNKPIALIGLGGVGKSFLGRLLGNKLSLPFIDCDDYLEQNYNQIIADIFAEEGETSFRQKEFETIKKILDANKVRVIATGGGCVTHAPSYQLLKEHSHTIWLDAPPEEYFDRIKDDDSRPLLHTDNPLETLKNLYKERISIYEQADIKIDVTSGNSDKIINTIIKTLSEPPSDDT